MRVFLAALLLAVAPAHAKQQPPATAGAYALACLQVMEAGKMGETEEGTDAEDHDPRLVACFNYVFDVVQCDGWSSSYFARLWRALRPAADEPFKATAASFSDYLCGNRPPPWHKRRAPQDPGKPTIDLWRPPA